MFCFEKKESSIVFSGEVVSSVLAAREEFWWEGKEFGAGGLVQEGHMRISHFGGTQTTFERYTKKIDFSKIKDLRIQCRIVNGFSKK